MTPPEHPVVHPGDFERIARSPNYRAMVDKKMRFIVAATVFFLVYYFALPISVGYFPEAMKKPVLGVVNAAYLFAVSQFFMAWVLAWLYMRMAARFDRDAERVVAEVLARPEAR
ncbi:MAG: DUF485 domain-containing protein [Acidobacteria bacterium]|nr:DUF485 domain-containing protein [Acidobacteriota bacterium]